jgi:hypothetical protein
MKNMRVHVSSFYEKRCFILLIHKLVYIILVPKIHITGYQFTYFTENSINMNIKKFLPKSVLLAGLLAVVPLAQSTPIFTNPSFNLTPNNETITGAGTFTGGGWEVTSGSLYVSYGVFGSPLPHHLTFSNEENTPPNNQSPNVTGSVKQTLAGTSTAPGTTYGISFDWNRDYFIDLINNVMVPDVGNLEVLFGSTVIGSFDPFATGPGTFSASGLLASSASTDFSLNFTTPFLDPNKYNEDRIYVTNFSVTEQTTIVTTPVPTPGTALLFGCGLIGLIGVAKRKKA